MQDVMQATGLEKGGIYRHFASKEELALEAFKHTMEQVSVARMGNIDPIQGALPQLRDFVRAFVDVPSPIPGGCPLMNVAADIDTGSQIIAAQARNSLGVWKSKICNILLEGIASDELRKEIEPEKIANLLIATLEGALMISRLEGNRQALLDSRESLERLLAGLANSQPGAAPLPVAARALQ